MILHFLLIGLRNFLKNKSSSLINALGLSLAVGCCLFVFLFIDFFLAIDEYHQNGEKIFVVHRIHEIEGTEEIHSGIPEPLGPALLETIEQVSAVSRVKDVQGYVRFEDQVFQERVRFVDPDFLQMFSFPLKWGNSKALEATDAIILSERMSEKYFGENNPVGEQMTIKFIIQEEDYLESFTVKGVAAEFNKKSSFRFGILLNYQKRLALGENLLNDWTQVNSVTFIQVDDAAEVGRIEEMTQEFISIQNEANKDYPIKKFLFEPLRTASLHAQNVRGNIFSGAGKEAFITLSILAFMMLSLACINFMNIGTASASYRLKEIGVRKVMGSTRRQLIVQFLAENGIICLLALMLGIIWTETFFLPGFRKLIPNPLQLDYSDVNLWLFMMSILAVATIGGAAYPAFYISKFQPVAVFRDKVKFSGKNPFRRILLASQYFVSFIAIVSAVVFIQNDSYQKSIDWGYYKDQVITVKVSGGSSYERLKNEVERIASVNSVTGSEDHIGVSFSRVSVKIGETFHPTDQLSVGWDYITTLGLEVVEGRAFDQNRQTDATQAIVVNRTFSQDMGWKEPVGRTVKIDDATFYVIGEVKDFHYESFGNEISPIVMRIAEPQNYRFLSASIGSADMEQAGDQIEAEWQKLFPDEPCDYFYQASVFDNDFRQYDIVTGVLSTAGFIAIFLAVIGLYGLSALSIRSRLKEVGIRKVLGGSLTHLGYILNREFVILLSISSLVAAPIGYFAVRALLDTITKYVMPMTMLPFLLTGVLLLIMSITAVAAHVFQAVSANPSHTLRME